MTFLYQKPAELPLFTFPLAAVDTETTLIETPPHDAKNRTRHGPVPVPTLILGSVAEPSLGVAVMRPPYIHDWILDWLNAGGHLVFHNVAFDYNVLVQAYGGGDFQIAMDRAIDENRVHDTQILELLVQIARGSNTVDDKVLKNPHLADLAQRRAGMTLNKDTDVRLFFSRFESPDSIVPDNFLEYAAQDALATYRVFGSLWRESGLYACPAGVSIPIRPDAESLFGRLTEGVQVKGAIALKWLEQFPLRVDSDAVQALHAQLSAEAVQLESALVSFGFAHRTRKLQRFSLSHVTLRRVLAAWAKDHHITPPFSTTGLLSLSYDFWADVLPTPTPAALSSPSTAVDDARLSVWLRYCRLHKLLATYIEPYATSPCHYPTYHNLGARTTRTACVRPNIQNIPKHRDGIRSLFVPSAGRVFIEADYKAAELVALAQVYHDMFGNSPLEEAINSGEDPHIATARRLAGPDWPTLSPAERKKLRQLAKAVNFGLPGGLGAKKFAKYGSKVARVPLTEDAARLLRRDALAADPALRAYLAERTTAEGAVRLAARNLGLSVHDLAERLGAARSEEETDDGQASVHWRIAARRLQAWRNGDRQYEIPTPPGFRACYDLFRETTTNCIGFVRGRTIYTAARNTPFQSLVASGAKLGLWNLYKSWSERLFEWSPVAFVHDSVLAETRPEHILALTEVLRTELVRGLQCVCPNLRVEADVTEPRLTWGDRTDALGRTIQVLPVGNSVNENQPHTSNAIPTP